MRGGSSGSASAARSSTSPAVGQSKLECVLGRLEGVKRVGEGYAALCPAHDDRKPSLSINYKDGKILLKCHGGCRPEAILDAIGLCWQDLFDDDSRTPSSSTKQTSGRGKIVKTYDYLDEARELLFQVVRLEPKDFRQRRPDGKGGWTWNLGRVRRVLYRLPEMRERVTEAGILYTVEGEKDADRLWEHGIPATTCPGGASKWRSEYTEQIRELCSDWKSEDAPKVWVITDNDEAGLKHELQVAEALGKAGIRTYSFRFGNRGQAKGYDISDWLDEGGNADWLRDPDRLKEHLGPIYTGYPGTGSGGSVRRSNEEALPEPEPLPPELPPVEAFIRRFCRRHSDPGSWTLRIACSAPPSILLLLSWWR